MSFITKLDFNDKDAYNPYFYQRETDGYGNYEKTDDTAETFLSGNCFIFAYYLREYYNYEIHSFIIPGTKFQHFFCECNSVGIVYYVDVRGIATQITDILEGLPFHSSEIPPIDIVDVEKELKDELNNTNNDEFTFQYARYLIDNHDSIYNIKAILWNRV